MELEAWEHSRQVPNNYVPGGQFADYNLEALFEMESAAHNLEQSGAYQSDQQMSQYLDLDGHAVPQIAAVNTAGQNGQCPPWLPSRPFLSSTPAELDIGNFFPNWNTAPVPAPQHADLLAQMLLSGVNENAVAPTSSMQNYRENSYVPGDAVSEDPNDTTPISNDGSNANASQDPLDGMDDFRALLETAQNDELFNTGTEILGGGGTKKARPSPKKHKRPRDGSLPKLLGEAAANAETAGLVPKYRAKNRLRSIIKRKPGTQDTDLMSNNVEILGGRVDKQTLAWLRENFEEQPGQIMRREFLYERYLEFCQMTGREPMNAACVGKVVRTVFQGLSTRRLGRRGGSKYHYVNLQVVESSPFASMGQSQGNAHKTGRKTKKQHSIPPAATTWYDSFKLPDESALEEAAASLGGLGPSSRVWSRSQKKLEAVELDFVTSGLTDEERSRRNIAQLAANCLLQVQIHVDHLILIPEELSNDGYWSTLIQQCRFTESVTENVVKHFLKSFRLHVGMLGSLIVRLNFHCVPDIINNFWQHEEPSLQVSTDLPLELFRAVLELEPVVLFIRKIFYQFYERIIGFFLPTRYGTVPEHLRAAFRDFTAKYDKWMYSAVQNLPQGAVQVLVSGAFAFARVTDQILDLTGTVEHLSLLDRQKPTRPTFLAALDTVIAHGCIANINVTPEDRMSVATLLLKLRDLADSRLLPEQWEYYVLEQQQRYINLTIGPSAEEMLQTQLVKQKLLDNFLAAWSRVVMELEGAVRFPANIGNPFHGVLRFLRESVGYIVDCQKACVWEKNLIALNADAIEKSIVLLMGSTPGPVDFTLEYYIQCGIPIPLVNCHSLEFFRGIPELSPLLEHFPCASVIDDGLVMADMLLDFPPELPELPLSPLPKSKRSSGKGQKRVGKTDGKKRNSSKGSVAGGKKDKKAKASDGET